MKNAVLRLAAAALCAAVAALPLSGGAGARQSNGDYSLPGSEAVTLSAADLIAEIYGETLSEEEKAVLSAYEDPRLSYAAQVPAALVSADFEGGELVLRAEEYAYTAANGGDAVFYPSRVAVGEKEAAFAQEGGAYAARLDAVREDGEYAEIEYAARFSVPAEQVNAAANAAYEAGKAAAEEIAAETAAYEAALAAYERASAEYAAYLAALERYEADSLAYDEYKKAYALWKDKYAVYEDYLDALAAYEAGVDAYENYLAEKERYAADLAAYRKYLADYAEYEKQYEIYYGQYGPTMDKIGRHLAAMALLDTPMTELNRTVRAAVEGSTVTSVIENKLTIHNVFGVPLETINRAGDATENLRKVFAAYFAAETDEERYLYYTLNYEFIAENVRELFVTLDALYRNAKVKNAVLSEDREEQYIILVAQLFVAAHALTDGSVYDIDGRALTEEGWTIAGLANAAPRTAAEVLGGKVYEDRDDAFPAEGGYPAGVVIPVEPERVEEPVPPDPVRMPTPPQEEEDPGPAPAEVKQPELPEETPLPGEEPLPYAPEESLQKLASQYETGVFHRRAELTEDYLYTARASARKKLYDVETFTVYFHYGEGGMVNVERGTYAPYYGETPVKESTPQYDYTFDCWVDEEGDPVDLSRAGEGAEGEELHVYPRFTASLRSYTISWKVGKNVQSALLPYGTDAETYAPVSPQLPDDGLYTFRFVGWDKEIVPVAADATYTAVFEKSFLLTWHIGGDTHYTAAYAGEDAALYAPAASLADEGNLYYEFIGWDRTPSAVAGDETYTAVFKKRYLLAFSDGRGAAIAVGEDGYTADCTATYDETFDLEQLLKRAEEAACGVTLLLRNGEVFFPYSSVAEMRRENAGGVTVRSSRGKYGSYEFDFGETGGGYAAHVFFAAAEYDETLTQLFTRADGEKTYVSHTRENGGVRFTAQTGKRYTLAAEYAVTTLPSAYVTLSADAADAAAGETVRLTVGTPPAGVLFEGIRVTAADGEEIAVENGAFTMPRAEVVAEAVCTPVVYTVSFVSDGRVVMSGSYRYGETLNAPQNLIKADDGEYSYTFVGWDKEVDPVVTENAVYTAVYRAEPLPKEDKPLSGIDKLFVAGIVLACVLGAAGVGAGAYFVARRVKRRRNGETGRNR